jgi:hypothetical protein
MFNNTISQQQTHDSNQATANVHELNQFQYSTQAPSITNNMLNAFFCTILFMHQTYQVTMTASTFVQNAFAPSLHHLPNPLPRLTNDISNMSIGSSQQQKPPTNNGQRKPHMITCDVN